MIVNARCSFLKQLKYPGEIEVATLVGAPGRSSFEMIHEIRLVGAEGLTGPVVYAEGGAKVVWVNFPAEKSVPLPDKIRSWLPGV